jgi:hypothetical protein
MSGGDKANVGQGLSQLFTDLHRNEQNGDYDKALKVANKSKFHLFMNHDLIIKTSLH